MNYLPRISSQAPAFTIATVLALATANASAQMHAHAHGQAKAAPAAIRDDPAALSEGEVKKVDKGAGELTIKHGPLNKAGMPGMTMAFKVRDQAMLDQVKAGDQVRFRAERVNGDLTITELRSGR